MGRLVLFLVVVAAALAGVWFYAPGGKDMLLGAKSQVMGMLPGASKESADEAAPAAPEAEEPADSVEETGDDAAGDEPQ